MFGMISSKDAARGVLKQMIGKAGSKEDPEVLTASKNQIIKVSKLFSLVAYVVLFFIGIPFIFIFGIGLLLIPLGWWIVYRYFKNQNKYLEEAHAELLKEMTPKF